MLFVELLDAGAAADQIFKAAGLDTHHVAYFSVVQPRFLAFDVAEFYVAGWVSHLLARLHFIICYVYQLYLYYYPYAIHLILYTLHQVNTDRSPQAYPDPYRYRYQQETAKVRKPVCPRLLCTVRLQEWILLVPSIPYKLSIWSPDI